MEIIINIIFCEVTGFFIFSHVRMMGYFRLCYVRINECPAGLELPAGYRNRRKATVKKKRRNPPLRILLLIQDNYCYLNIFKNLMNGWWVDLYMKANLFMPLTNTKPTQNYDHVLFNCFEIQYLDSQIECRLFAIFLPGVIYNYFFILLIEFSCKK